MQEKNAPVFHYPTDLLKNGCVLNWIVPRRFCITSTYLLGVRISNKHRTGRRVVSVDKPSQRESLAAGAGDIFFFN